MSTLNQFELVPLPSVYKHDPDVRILGIDILTDTNQRVFMEPIMHEVADAALNGFNSLVLTSPVLLSDVLKINTPNNGRLSLLTNISINNKYWVHEESPNPDIRIIKLIENPYQLGDNSIFEITFLDDENCTIQVKYPLLPSIETAWEIELDSNNNLQLNSSANSPFIFKYIWDRDNHRISLFYGNYTNVIHVNNDKVVLGTLAPSESFTYFQIRPDFHVPQKLINQKWVSYSRNPFQVTHAINPFLTRYKAPTQLLLTAAYNNSDKEMQWDILSLNNYLTSNNHLSYSSYWVDPVFHRRYTSIDLSPIFENNINEINLNYISFNYDIIVKPDTYTTFTLPFTNTDTVNVYNTRIQDWGELQDYYNLEGLPNFSGLYPYVQLNINDSMLGYSGLVAGSNPLYSDKIISRAAVLSGANYEQTGQYLCTWLSAAPTPEQAPVWIDRYYQPQFITEFDALQTSPQINPYISEAEQLSIAANIQNIPIFDKISDVVLVPGQTYTVFHMGKEYINYVIQSFGLQKIGLQYKQVTMGVAAGSSEDTNKLIFDGSKYLVTMPTVLKENNITLQFSLDSADWSQKMGHLLIGNYVDRGIGVFNETKITPFIIVHDTDTVYIFTLDFNLVTQRKFNKEIGTIVRTDYLSYIYVIFKDFSVIKMHPTGHLMDEIGKIQFIEPEWPPQQRSLYINETHAYISLRGQGDTAIFDTSSIAIYLSSVTDNYFVDSLLEPIIAHRYPIENEPGSSSELYLGAQHDSYPNETSNRPPFGTYIRYKDQKYIIPGIFVRILEDYIFMFLTVDQREIKIVDLRNAPNIDDSLDAYTSFASVKEGNIINNFVIDDDKNIYIVKNGNVIIKMNVNKQILAIKNIAADSTYIHSIDVISEFKDNKHYQGILLLGEKDIVSEETGVITKASFAYRLDTNLVTLKTNYLFGKNDSIVEYVPQIHDPLNFNTLRVIHIENAGASGNVLRFSVRLKKKLSTFDYLKRDIYMDISRLCPGKHTFTIVFDATNGFFKVYIDNLLFKEEQFEPKTFVFEDIFNSKFYIGATPYYDNYTLSQITQLSSGYVCYGNNEMSNISIYNSALSLDQIRFLSVKDKEWDDVVISVPSGIHNHQETISNTIRNQIPGYASSKLRVIVKGISDLDQSLKSVVDDNIRREVYKHAPVNTEVVDIVYAD